MARTPPIAEVVDLFCGVGALSHGLLQAGLKILAGYDMDARCKYAFETNNKATFHTRDVGTLTAAEVKSHFTGSLPTVLAGCAPCQPFSSYKQRYDEDPQWNLVASFARLATEVQPDFVTMENVPALIKYKDGRVFSDFCNTLRASGYKVEWQIARCEKYGVPQKRKRLVLIASKSFAVSELKEKTPQYRTVKQAIGALPPLSAGQTDPDDGLHKAATLSELNLQRIRLSRPGRTWRDWPIELRSPCHRKETGLTYPGVYARMSWDEPSPTMTTQCYGFGNGRFGHPEQDRAISLREAAILQSFPKRYKFLPKNEEIQFKEVGRWIGNAVPVKLAKCIGESICTSIAPGGSKTDDHSKTISV